jgi:hypothetical protein
MSRGVKPDSLAFNHQLKALIDKHFRGDNETAARTLGVTVSCVQRWVKGTSIPGFERQVTTLRKLRSL